MAARGAPTATTDPYAALAKITDPHLRASLKQILDQVIDLRGRASGIGGVSRPLGTPLDAAGHALTQIADPQAPGDAVNLRTLQQYVEGILSGSIPKPAARPAPTAGVPTPAGPIDPPPPPPPPPPPGDYLPPQAGTGNLRIVGKLFRKPDGSVYRWKSCTDFLLLQKYLNGEDITPILASRTAQGATMVRVFGMWKIPEFDASAYPNYYTSLAPFAALLAGAGLDLQLTVFTSCQDFPNFKEVPAQRAHLLNVRNALVASPNVVLELVNEWFQNGVEPLQHSRPIGILTSRGSGTDGGGPYIPPWDFGELHPPRDNEWFRKAKDAMEFADQLGRPCVSDEPMGAYEVVVPGRRDNDPNHFYWFAAISMLLAAGATFHSEDGIFSRFWGPIQQQCASQFYAAINAIPENVMGGTYTRSGLSDLPIQYNDDALRIYARYTAHDACCVIAAPTGSFTLVPTGAWTVTSTTGPLDSHGSGTLVVLAR